MIIPRKRSSAFWRSLFVRLLLILCTAGAVGAQEAAQSAVGPWLAGPFEGAADEIYARAVALTEGRAGTATMLFQGVKYRFAADGRLEIRRHWVYRILDSSALEDWSVSQMRWSPWHQGRPEIRARVINAEGARWADPSAFEERAAPEKAGGSRGQRRLISGQLPGVVVGSVVEEEIVLRENRPAFPWGTTHRHYTSLFIPTLHGRVDLEASTRLALRYGARKMPGLEPTSTEVTDNEVRVRFDFYDMPAVTASEDGLPAHRPRYPHLAFSTGRSWNWVATGLGQLFEGALTRTRLDGLASRLPAPTDPLQDRLDQILAAVRDQVSYNGLELNASPMEPNPDQVLASGSGDGFDIALTLVAAFRRVGLESSLALINSGFGIDVEPRLPGFGLFNHALVRVTPGPGQDPIWVDPISLFTRPGDLPLAAQGRFALIIGPQTDKLVLTPTAEPEDNLAREVREVFFSDFGPGRIHETCHYFGSAERSQRRITKGLSLEDRRRGYQAYAQAFHHAGSLETLEETAAEHLAEPFRLYLEVTDSNRARTHLDHAVLEIPIRELARRVPAALLAEDDEPRRGDYVFPEPFVTEWEYIIHPPEGFGLPELPPSQERSLGPAELTIDYQRQRRADGERILARLRFDVGQRILAPVQFDEMKRELRDFLAEPPMEIRFDSMAGELMASGDYDAAFRRLGKAVERRPGQAGRRVRLALALQQIGLVREAELQARQAVALAPAWSLAHWALGRTLEYDDLGRRYAPEAPLDRALESLQEAIRLSPADPTIRAALPRLLNRSADGFPGPGASPDEAIGAYKAWRKEFARPDLDQELANLLSHEGRRPELATLLDQIAQGSPRALAARIMATEDGVETVSLEELTDEAVREVAKELVLNREYQAAERLMRRAGVPVWSWLSASRRVEDMDTHPQDPTTPIIHLVASLGSPGVDRSAVAEWLHPRLEAQGAGLNLRQLRDRLDLTLPEKVRGWGPSPQVWGDLVIGQMQPSLAGAPHLGYRVGLGVHPAEQLFVTPFAGELRVAASGAEPAYLGMEALDRLDQGDIPGSGRWLEWAWQVLPPAQSTSDPLGFEPFRSLWRGDLGDRPARRAIRVAAAALASGQDRSGVSLAILGEAEAADLRGVAVDDVERVEVALDVARLQAYSTGGAYLDLEALASTLGDEYPRSERAFEWKVEALTALGEWSTFIARAEARHRQWPNDTAALRSLAHWALRQPDLEAAHTHFGVLLKQNELTSGDAGAWVFALMADPEANARRAREVLEATAEDGRNDALWLRAHSMMLAMDGKPKAALESLVAAIEMQDTQALTVEDGFLIGRLAEGAGLPAVAHERYSHLLANRDLKERSPLVHMLLERGLKRLRSGG